jgi:hypothetical protein
VDPTGRSQRINGAGARHWGRTDIAFEPRTGGSFPVRGIYRRTYTAVDPETQVAVQSANPLLVIEDSELPLGEPPAEGDVFVVSGVRYTVHHREVEGEGTTRVFLRLV